MPDGELATYPVPVPDLDTVKLYLPAGGGGAKVAATVVSALMVTTHVPVPEQLPPDQPEKEWPESGVAVSVTVDPLL
jgi:hypothetical protein